MNTISFKIDGYKLTFEFRDQINKTDKQGIKEILKSEVDKFNKITDRYDPESEIFEFNNSINEFHGSKEFFDYFSDAVHWFGITDGIFNPFVTSVLDDIHDFNIDKSDWKDEGLFRMNNVSVDFPESISELSKFIQIDYTNYQVKILRPVRLDLNGISKGKFIDKVCRKIGNIVHSYSLHVGGDAFYKNSGPEDASWVVNVKNPVVQTEGVFDIEARDEAVSVSGLLGQKKIMDEGHDYILLNPMNQMKVKNNLAMVVIKASSASKSDVLAKTFFIATEAERAVLSKKFTDIYRLEIDLDGKLTVY